MESSTFFEFALLGFLVVGFLILVVKWVVGR